MLRPRRPLLGPAGGFQRGVVYILIYDAGLFLFSPFCRFCPLSCGNVVSATWSRLCGVGSPCTGQLCFFKQFLFFHVSIYEDFVTLVYADRDRDNVPVDW